MAAMELRRLGPAWTRPLTALRATVSSTPHLDGGVLSQRRGLTTRRAALASATAVSVRPRRPRRLTLVVSSADGSIEVDLLRLGDVNGWSRTAEELEALADGIAPVAGPVAGALRTQAAFLRSDVPYVSMSPLAAFVGPAEGPVDRVRDAMPDWP
jgi:hypothetical protein